MAVTCTPGNLVDLASCFSCLSQRQRDAIKTYLTAVWASVEPDPGTLLEAAKCFLCLERDQLLAIQTYLLCTEGGGGGGFNLSGSGSPVGVQLPSFVGQYDVDTATNPDAIWVSTGATSADWTLTGNKFHPAEGIVLFGNTAETLFSILDSTLGGGLHISSNTMLQTLEALNLATVSIPSGGQITFTITNNNVLSAVSFPALSSLGGISGVAITFQGNPLMTTLSLPLWTGGSPGLGTNLTIGTGNTALASINLNSLVRTNRLSVTTNPALTSLTLPSFTTIESTIFQIINNVTLTSISLPAFVSTNSASATLVVTGNTLLATLSLPACTTILNGITANGLANLTTVVLTNYLPTNAKAQNFNGCALTQASVDHVLARCVANAAYVSGTVSLDGGTNATPSAAGLADKATLIGRGCTVNTN